MWAEKLNALAISIRMPTCLVKWLPGGADGSKFEAYVLFPGRRWAPDRYCISALNKCLNPLNQLRLKGRVDEDITDLILLYERGECLPQDLNSSVLDRFEEAKAGPLTGADPSGVN